MMRIRSVHLAFVKFFGTRLPITAIEALWNHQAMPLLNQSEKMPRMPLQRTQSSVPVVEPAKAQKNQRAIAQTKPDVVSQIIDPAANALECGS